MSAPTRGIVIAATASRSGKTTFTLGLARALKRRGHDVRVAKSGPDYIDPGYHEVATQASCVNIDAWAMPEARIRSQLGADITLIEGAMGLFDGAADGTGSAAHLAKMLGLPIILVIDCASLSQSVAAIVKGFTTLDTDLEFAGLVLNNIGSPRHERLLRAALPPGIPVLGAIGRNAALRRPSRHLGLVQAHELASIENFVDRVADQVETHTDIDTIMFALGVSHSQTCPPVLKPPGQHISVAKDAAFTFLYAHMLNDWRSQGASVTYFSPLADEPPHPDADAIFLPGGYPELYAKDLARAGIFRQSMQNAARRGITIVGECGGYMVMGQRLTDKHNIPYPMLGLLDLETSFANPRLHLGYRLLKKLSEPLQVFKGHEFHYAVEAKAEGQPLFMAQDAAGEDLGHIGLVKGTVSGSFAHIIDAA